MASLFLSLNYWHNSFNQSCIFILYLWSCSIWYLARFCLYFGLQIFILWSTINSILIFRVNTQVNGWSFPTRLENRFFQSSGSLLVSSLSDKVTLWIFQSSGGNIGAVFRTFNIIAHVLEYSWNVDGVKVNPFLSVHFLKGQTIQFNYKKYLKCLFL